MHFKDVVKMLHQSTKLVSCHRELRGGAELDW